LANKKINKEFIINSLFPNVATKEGVKELRSEMTQLRREIA
jgi:two-component SAPR family response regulator